MTDVTKPNRRPRRPSSTAPTTPDPVEIAMEAEASGMVPTGEASALLRRHAALIDKQIVLANNQIFRNRILVVVVVALLLTVGTVVWTASRTTGLVIQPFSVPPELVEDGLDGRAVAALFQDELVRLDTATNASGPAASFRNDWSGAISVEVEAGGLSLTDAYTALTRWLGKETYVSGGLSRTADGLQLVVRSSDGTAVSVQGRPGDQPEVLMREAAAEVYELTQPYRYSSYLGQQGEALTAGPEQQAFYDRRTAILARLLDSPSLNDRVWAFNGLASGPQVSTQDSNAILLTALEVDPEHPHILYNLVWNSQISGHPEAQLGYAQRIAASWSNPRNRPKVNADRQTNYSLQAPAFEAELQGDWLEALELYTRLVDGSERGTSGFRADRVRALIALHQPSALQRLIAEDDLRALGRPGPGEPGFGRANPGLGQGRPDLRAAAAAALDQWPQVVAALETWETEVAPTLNPRGRPVAQTRVRPRLAYARARTGDLAGAQTLIAATPLDCYLCVRERARIAELAGDRAAADRWSAEARRQGPSLPFAFAERGQMLMARGDPAGAIAFYEQAVERGPRWADPQKFWGDALAAQGDETGAIRRYRAAADRAPQWGALHLAWGRALEAQGRRDQAREKYAQAARMDLSDADRAEVVRRLAVRVG